MLSQHMSRSTLFSMKCGLYEPVLMRSFRRVFEAASEMAEKAGHVIEIPRRCKRQTLRSHVEADTPEAYYRISVFVPFIDNMVEQLASCFSQLTVHACRALLLIPANVETSQMIMSRSCISITNQTCPLLCLLNRSSGYGNPIGRMNQAGRTHCNRHTGISTATHRCTSLCV